MYRGPHAMNSTHLQAPARVIHPPPCPGESSGCSPGASDLISPLRPPGGIPGHFLSPQSRTRPPYRVAFRKPGLFENAPSGGVPGLSRPLASAVTRECPGCPGSSGRGSSLVLRPPQRARSFPIPAVCPEAVSAPAGPSAG